MHPLIHAYKHHQQVQVLQTGRCHTQCVLHAVADISANQKLQLAGSSCMSDWLDIYKIKAKIICKVSNHT